MIEKDVIANVDGKQIFNLNEVYRLYMDREDIADNLVRRWSAEVHVPLDVSSSLVMKIIEFFQEAVVTDEDGLRIDVE